MDTYAHDGASWRKLKQIYAHDGYSWRKLKKMYCHDGSAWKLVFGGEWTLMGSAISVSSMVVWMSNLYRSTGGNVETWNGSSWVLFATSSYTISKLVAAGTTLWMMDAYGDIFARAWGGSSWIAHGSSNKDLCSDGYAAYWTKLYNTDNNVMRYIAPLTGSIIRTISGYVPGFWIVCDGTTVYLSTGTSGYFDRYIGGTSWLTYALYSPGSSAAGRTPVNNGTYVLFPTDTGLKRWAGNALGWVQYNSPYIANGAIMTTDYGLTVCGLLYSVSKDTGPGSSWTPLEPAISGGLGLVEYQLSYLCMWGYGGSYLYQP